MQDQLVSFETAKLAKEKGFDVDCISAYLDPDDETLYYKDKAHNWNGREKLLKSPNKFCSAPTQSLLQRWLREVHKLHIHIEDWELVKWYFTIRDGRDTELPVKTVNITKGEFEFLSYEEALEKGLQKALKLIE